MKDTSNMQERTKVQLDDQLRVLRIENQRLLLEKADREDRRKLTNDILRLTVENAALKQELIDAE